MVYEAGHFLVDNSDASGEESNDGNDRYLDPPPTDPDMTGWTTNQIGCYVCGNTNTTRKSGIYKGRGSNPADV